VDRDGAAGAASHSRTGSDVHLRLSQAKNNIDKYCIRRDTPNHHQGVLIRQSKAEMLGTAALMVQEILQACGAPHKHTETITNNECGHIQ